METVLKKGRIRYIDIARAFAIIIIVVGHTFVHSAHCGEIFKFFYSFNVALFFILSGLTFRAEGNFLHFFLKKFLKIMIPYFIWAFLFIIPFLLFGDSVGDSLGTGGSSDMAEIIKNVFYGNGADNALKQNTPLWFLPALFSMEIIYYLIIKLTKDKFDLIKLILLILVGFLSASFLAVRLPWGINTVLNIGAGSFFAGYLLKKYKLLDKLFKLPVMLIILAIGIICYFLNNMLVTPEKSMISYVDYSYGVYFLALPIGFSFSLFVIYLASLLKQNKILELVGLNTLGILIFHKLIIVIFQTKLGPLSGILADSNLGLEIMLTAVITIITIAVSLIITKIFKLLLPVTVGEKIGTGVFCKNRKKSE